MSEVTSVNTGVAWPEPLAAEAAVRRMQVKLHSWREVRRRFCDVGWRYACNGVVFRGASSVAVVRYRYRGNRIPTPWTTLELASTN